MSFLPRFITESMFRKIFASFVVILLLLVAIFSVSYRVIMELGAASSKILKMNYNSIVASARMMEYLDTIQLEYASGADSDSLRQQRIANAANSFSQWLGRSWDNITEQGEKESLATLDSLYVAYISTVRSSDFPELPESTQLRLMRLRNEIKEQCQTLSLINQRAMFTKSVAAQKIARRGSFTLLVVTMLVLLLGLVLSWGLARRIIRPIQKLKEATNKIATGDYSVALATTGEDELGSLTADFNQMADKLRTYNEVNVRKILAEQQKIEAIFANIQDGILFVGLDCVILDANNTALEVFRLKRKEVIGHHFLELIKQEELFNDLRKCLDTGTTPEYPEHNNVLSIRQNEKQTHFEYSFTPILSANGDLMGVMLLLRNITSIKELDRLKSEFVMIVSHELKTPLTSLNMSIDLILESLGEHPDKQHAELLHIAKEDINRLKFLISDLLDLSKIEAGKIDMHFAAVSPCRMLEAIASYFQPQMELKEVISEIKCPAGLDDVWCDEEKLTLVFSNLLANALNAVKSGGKIVLQASGQGNYILFSVSDDGIGIPLEYQNKIFDRFVQVEEHKAAGGTGLGLTISREIVRAHGGSIWVESAPHQGATFFFTIPCAHSTPKLTPRRET